jgi:DNA-binding MarR family transcriptional regulator
MTHTLTSTLREIVLWIDHYADALLKDKFDISYSWFSLMKVLLDNEPINQRQLAINLGHSEAAVSKLVPRLEALELIERVIDPDNSHRHILSLTTEGRNITISANKLLEAVFLEYLKKSAIDIKLYTKLTSNIASVVRLAEYSLK